ncbi:unnamed protein product [Chrysodeixis includens]|uniref:Uncharacterized protein n=1 Tax=Chrysodeixis includens TaxID=689277 RepID=A0A9N8KUE6_CHRIL|nr:unnamed protein product [Chrysodeixis includens]
MSGRLPGEEFRRHALAISMAAALTQHPHSRRYCCERLFARRDPIDCKRICSKFEANYVASLPNYQNPSATNLRVLEPLSIFAQNTTSVQHQKRERRKETCFSGPVKASTVPARPRQAPTGLARD